MSGRVFSWILYAAVGVFFAAAAIVKIIDPEAFLSSMLTYEVFSYKQAVGLAFYAPMLELVVALGLITGFWRKGAALLTLFLLVLFIVLVGQGLVRGLQMDCGCFGANQLQTSTDYYLKIGQNLMLLVAVGLAWVIEKKSSKN